ncbi:MAG: hypothetical protein ACFE9R_13685 [Candidatus Hermodarchaeota archaeon]
MPAPEDPNNEKLILKLVACSRCGNPFMVKKGEKGKIENICDNCIKLEERKRTLTNSVIKAQREIENNIKSFKSSLRLARSQQIKQKYFDKIKKTSDVLSKSIELLHKIEDTNDEKYIDEYKILFDQLKKDYTDKNNSE